MAELGPVSRVVACLLKRGHSIDETRADTRALRLFCLELETSSSDEEMKVIGRRTLPMGCTETPEKPNKGDSTGVS
ncbi:hypothetical protein Taro_034184 [Colocasia esculenta]|uniref:Uncharacterized protein n=1 Tax=Colocasia esculenta TaxID=4460 RepID=A0A843W3D5_COLES|nr:hypothetical protein [Colocasia esculenta]